MKMALKSAKVNIDEVDYINAHGTSTAFNDKFESIAIGHVFGDHAKNIAISSTKSVTGHLLGGAGGVEACFTVKSIFHQIAPPTINYEQKTQIARLTTCQTPQEKLRLTLLFPTPLALVAPTVPSHLGNLSTDSI